MVGGEECERPQRLKECLAHNNDEVYKSKLAFIWEQRSIPTTPDYESLSMVTMSWIDIWHCYERQLANRSRILFTEKTDREHLQALIAACTEYAKADPMALVPIDIAWVDGLVDHNLPAYPPNSTAVE